ncbi:MAG: alpha/beta fold hydrolase [Planctomycetes bacterium]|nr:alpha/beta fold hydrolase [Planctomycetota bacterium]
MTSGFMRHARLCVLIFAAAGRASAGGPALDLDNRSVVDHLGGRGRAFTMTSAILGETRRIDVATPESFDVTGPNRRYPVILVFDGEYNFAHTTATAQYLAEAGQIPEALVVAVENIGGNEERVRDLTPPGLSVSGSSLNEGGDRFLDFLEKELLPALATQFRAGPPNVLIGHSSGGILVTYAAATRTTVFPFIVSIDAPTHLQDGWLVAQLVAKAQKPPAKPLRYASLESRFGWSDKDWAALQSAAPASWKLHREKLAHETHNSMPLLATYLGLREVFADYSMLAARDSPTSAALEHYRKFNESLGVTVVPPRPLLGRVIEDLLIEGNAKVAQSALDSLIAGYGDTPNAATIRAQIAEAAKLPPLTETVEDLLSAPKPDPKAMAPFLGEWNGTIRHRGSIPEPLRVRLEVQGGVVTGVLTHFPEPGVELPMPLQYVKIVEGGLHFGFMNGMRPRGMIVYEGILHDGKLEGEALIRGVRFERPPGAPDTHFSLQLTKPATRKV